MKNLKFFTKMFLALFVLSFSACGGGSSNIPNDGADPTDQHNIDAAFQEVANLAAFVTEAFNSEPEGCEDIEATLNNLSDTFNCSDSGTVAYNLNDFECGGSSLTITFTFTADLNNCTEVNGNTINGNLTIDYEASEEEAGLTATVSSSGLSHNGVSFMLEDMEVVVDSQTNSAISCSGSASVDGSSCDIAEDCSACPL